MGRRARNLVEKEYTAALYQQRVISIYRELGVPVPVGWETQATA
jgi:hypothetical protein